MITGARGVAIALVATVSVLTAQENAPAQKPAADKAAAVSSPAPRPGIVPLKLNIVVSKYQSDKRTSSLPYMLSLNSDNQRVSLRMGAQVPLTTGGGGADKTATQYTYRDVGLHIDAQVLPVDTGLYRVNVTVNDSTIVTPSQVQGAPQFSGAPVFRSFSANNSVVLRDGQSTQLSSAADPLSGEVMRLEVTLNLAK